MPYSAITIDTSIFDRQGCRLESGLLKQLDQFYGMPAGIVLSEIVIREVGDHMKKSASEAIAQIDQALSKCQKALNTDRESIEYARRLLHPDNEPRELVRDRLQRFLGSNGGQVVRVEEQISIDQIVMRYFSSEPPFSESGNKKNEFPDAMALLSLEQWAKKNGFRILAVSADSDWRDFADQSDRIDCMEDFASALEHFQPDNKAHRFCDFLKTILSGESDHPIADEIFNEVSSAISDHMPMADAQSGLIFEPDIVEIEAEYVRLTNDAELIPVQAQEDSLAVQARFSVTATARSSFEFFVRDSIDKDYVRIGSCDASIEIEPEVDILIHLSGDFSSEEDVSVDYIEVLHELESVDFGEVEPS